MYALGLHEPPMELALEVWERLRTDVVLYPVSLDEPAHLSGAPRAVRPGRA
jgi:hypothetical protein